jgi:hypothetical protein
MLNIFDIVSVFLIFIVKIAFSTEILTPPRSFPKTQVTTPWTGTTTRDLHREYNNIFKYGNRNAASHRWSTFLLRRSEQMTLEKLTLMFTGFCAVSGSPITPSDFNRYGLTLDSVSGESTKAFGFMHYCCWPCVCDTQDFIKVDTKNVTTSDGLVHKQHFAVIGNPCDHPDALITPFVQPFDGRSTTLQREAAEVRCNADGSLEGATMSDHGYVIINMFFDAEPIYDQDSKSIVRAADQNSNSGDVASSQNTPGRLSTKKSFHNNDPTLSYGNIKYQSEREYQGHCMNRAQNGYNSGMGEIFRKVANISPIPVLTVGGGNSRREEL